MFNLVGKRRIAKLAKELEIAKKMICEFIWEPDRDKEQHRKYLIKCAKFAGCEIPEFNVCNEEETKRT